MNAPDDEVRDQDDHVEGTFRLGMPVFEDGDASPRWCKCGHRKADHSGGFYECWSQEEVIEGFGTTCSCYRYAASVDREGE